MAAGRAFLTNARYGRGVYIPASFRIGPGGIAEVRVTGGEATVMVSRGVDIRPIEHLGGWGSRFMILAEEAELHRRTYIAIIDSCLPAVGGRAGLALRAGVTEAFVSYLRSWNYVRNPSRRTAERIAGSLPLPQEIRESMLRHMELSGEKRLEALRIARPQVRGGDGSMLVQEIAMWHSAAYSAGDPVTARRLYSAVRESAHLYLLSSSPAYDGMNFLQACFLLHDALNTLNRPDQALYVAGIARNVSRRLAYAGDRESAWRMHWNEVNALRASGVALHNLHLDRDAFLHYEEARHLAREMKLAPALWEPYLNADAIKAVSALPRFSIRDLRTRRDRAVAFLHKAPQLGDLWALIVAESLLRAHIRYAHERPGAFIIRSATREADELLRLLGSVAGVGPLHRVLVLRSAAQLNQLKGDLDGWRHFTGSAYDLALAAGLSHQAEQIIKEGGLDVARIVEQRTEAPGIDRQNYTDSVTAAKYISGVIAP